MNKEILKNYNLKYIPEVVKKYNIIIEEKPQFLTFEKVKNFIENLSKIAIERQIEEIKENGRPII